MAAAVGTTSVLFRVGSGSPSRVYRGSTAVQDVPVFVSGGPPFTAPPAWNGSYTHAQVTTQGLADYGLPILELSYERDTNEGVPLVPSDADSDGPGLYYADFAENLTGQALRVRVRNAIGWGPFSAYENVVDNS